MALKLSSTIVVLTTIALILPSYAEDSPRDYLTGHNAERANLGLKLVKWDPKIAEYARKTASQHIENCELEHSTGPYAENLAGGSGPMTGRDATNMWLSEKEFYDVKTGSCAPNHECGHYENIIAPDTTRIGCAKIECLNGGLIFQCDYAADYTQDPTIELHF